MDKLNQFMCAVASGEIKDYVIICAGSEEGQILSSLPMGESIDLCREALQSMEESAESVSAEIVENPSTFEGETTIEVKDTDN